MPSLRNFDSLSSFLKSSRKFLKLKVSCSELCGGGVEGSEDTGAVDGEDTEAVDVGTEAADGEDTGAVDGGDRGGDAWVLSLEKELGSARKLWLSSTMNLRFNPVVSRPVEELMEISLAKELNIVEARFVEVFDKSV